MLKRRVIPCLDIENGRTVKGTNFIALKDAGDPVELAKQYASDGADELVFLDITATVEKRKTMLALVEEVAAAINIPFTVGGGINSLDDAARLIQCGADKVSINSSAVRNPALISDIAGRYGSQCVVVAIDVKYTNKGWRVFIDGGRTDTSLGAIEWAKYVAQCGAGEILLTSMDNDGAKTGFALELTCNVCNAVSIPVIASGGAGNCVDFYELFYATKASGALAAGIFHYGELAIPELKQYLKSNKIDVR